MFPFLKNIIGTILVRGNRVGKDVIEFFDTALRSAIDLRKDGKNEVLEYNVNTIDQKIYRSFKHTCNMFDSVPQSYFVFKYTMYINGFYAKSLFWFLDFKLIIYLTFPAINFTMSSSLNLFKLNVLCTRKGFGDR